jgi:hypothetical protein
MLLGPGRDRSPSAEPGDGRAAGGRGSPARRRTGGRQDAVDSAGQQGATDSGWWQAVRERHGRRESERNDGGSGGSGAGGPSGAAQHDRTEDAASGRGPRGPRLGGPRSGFVAVERGWRQPPPSEARPGSAAGAESEEAGVNAGRRARGREGSAWDDPER